MHHNYQIATYGSCNCKCHKGYDNCNCGLTSRFRSILNFGIKKPSRKPKRVNIESRVKPFTKARAKQVIAYTKEHGFHEPGYVH